MIRLVSKDIALFTSLIGHTTYVYAAGSDGSKPLINLREIDFSRSSLFSARLRVVVNYTNHAKVSIQPVGDVAFDVYYRNLFLSTIRGTQISLLPVIIIYMRITSSKYNVLHVASKAN